MLPVFNNSPETPCMKVGLDARISLVRLLSAGGRGRKFLKIKFFHDKKPKAISNTNLI